jgi:hypothetical protein
MIGWIRMLLVTSEVRKGGTPRPFRCRITPRAPVGIEFDEVRSAARAAGPKAGRIQPDLDRCAARSANFVLVT